MGTATLTYCRLVSHIGERSFVLNNKPPHPRHGKFLPVQIWVFSPPPALGREAGHLLHISQEPREKQGDPTTRANFLHFQHLEKKQQWRWKQGWKHSSEEKTEKTVPSSRSRYVPCGLSGGWCGGTRERPQSVRWVRAATRQGLCQRRKAPRALLPRTRGQSPPGGENA